VCLWCEFGGGGVSVFFTFFFLSGFLGVFLFFWGGRVCFFFFLFLFFFFLGVRTFLEGGDSGWTLS